MCVDMCYDGVEYKDVPEVNTIGAACMPIMLKAAVGSVQYLVRSVLVYGSET